MPLRVGKWQQLDRMAITLSGLCLVHCLLTLLLLGALSSLGHLFADPRIHEAGLALATLLAAFALGMGAFRHGNLVPLLLGAPGLALMAGALLVGHGWPEAVLTMLGVSLVAAAHLVNFRSSATRC